MKKPVVPRFLLLLLVYAAVFLILVQFQFSQKTNFTRRAGDLVIEGNYGPNQNHLASTNVYLSGETSVFFGGMEFRLGNGLELAGPKGTAAACPTMMTLTDNEAYFRLAEGPELVFTTQYTGGSIELVIRADFAALSGDAESDLAETSQLVEYHSLKVPFKPLETSYVSKNDSLFLLNANGVNYTFNRAAGTDSILLEANNPAISYRVLPDREAVSPRDFIIAGALETETYETALTLWLDQSYSSWNRTVGRDGTTISGELISAYMSESLKRGTYKAAAAAVNASVYSAGNSPDLSYEASAYMGRLETALRTLSAAELERYTRLARLVREKSPEFFKEPHCIEFLAVRGYNNLMDDAAEMLRTFDPANMTIEQAVGFLESCRDWVQYRSGRYNPFDRFVDQALFVITGSLRKNSAENRVLAFTKTAGSGEEADAELNLRLGRALLRWEDETRTALGRTLIFSVLSMANNSGAVPRVITKNFTGGHELLDSFKVYRICFVGENYARSQPLDSGLWAWSAASSLGSVAGEGRLDFAVQFPAGETHYMMIRGVRPFAVLQFNGYISATDNQFERYDSSGWIYSAAEQTLLIKVRQRLPTERISVLY